MEESDKPEMNVAEEIKPSLTRLQGKSENLQRLIETLESLQREGAYVYVDNPEDSAIIHVIVKHDEPLIEMVNLARMNDFLIGEATDDGILEYKYGENEYRVDKKFRTNR